MSPVDIESFFEIFYVYWVTYQDVILLRFYIGQSSLTPILATLTGIAGQTVPPAPAPDSSAHAAGAQEVAVVKVAVAVALRCNAIANVANSMLAM